MHFLYDGKIPYLDMVKLALDPKLIDNSLRIETQDVFFKHPETVRRYIEIGPSKVLATMAEKTIAQKYSVEDKARLVHRQILSHSHDTKAIYYEYEENDEVEAPPSASVNSDTASTVKTSATLAPKQSATVLPDMDIATQGTKVSAQSIEDAPLSASDVVLALTGQKLKQPTDEVPMHKSLRDLSGGIKPAIT